MSEKPGEGGIQEVKRGQRFKKGTHLHQMLLWGQKSDWNGFQKKGENETEYKQLFQEALLLRRNWALAGERTI